jgi:hypothetical protein
MQPWVTSPSFVVDTPQKVVASPWAKAPEPVEAPAYQSDENLKKQYGIELAKSSNPFEAACKIFDETSKALWVSFNWLADPVVIASRDIYLKTLELSAAPLDREQLAAKVLKLAEGEKVERNGVFLSTIEAKDRIAAFKLYSDILGYTGKVEIDNSTNNNLNVREMVVKLVRADNKEPVTINSVPNLNVKSEIANQETKSPIVLKMVGGGVR